MRNSFVTSSHVNLPWFAVLVATIAVLCQKEMLRTSAFFALTKLFTTVHIFRELARSNGFWIPLSLERQNQNIRCVRLGFARRAGSSNRCWVCMFRIETSQIRFCQKPYLGFSINSQSILLSHLQSSPFYQHSPSPINRLKHTRS